ncbi:MULTISPECIES: hypothetical protein [Pontibacillus]|uniref:Uncharacterized protein n=1 Tax=Pontibacillus chungwhensis TaxID=265426 RepID=A0ABY8V177_9BACI|nr:MULTISPECIES: hypothetical protein [Pontibacillus]MCD5324310.1 hypothetical protein [Pontibacillus sp. HN14]WIF99393.1 hypothetical protein QNI29_06970 [Pontibacillus chungwhensis]
MRKSLYVVLLTGVVFFLMGFKHAPDNDHVMYVEKEQLKQESDQVLKAAKDQQVTLLYVELDQNQSDSFYQSFITRAQSEGIAVYAWGGSPSWGLTTHQDEGIAFVKWVKSYNDRSEDSAHFRGLNVDIKAYHLPLWNEDQEEVLKGWKENVQTLTARAQEAGLTVTETIPFWLDTLETPGTDGTPFHEWLMNQYDQTTILAFRETLEGDNGIMSLIETELETADRTGNKLLIGVTMEDTGLDYVTFAEEGVPDMNMHLGVLEEHAGEHPSYAGTAFQSYQYVKDQLNLDAEQQTESEVKHEKTRGTYIWEAERLINEGDNILAFAKEKNLNFLYVRLDLRQPYSSYSPFVKKAHEAGIEVHAMGGHPTWAEESERYRIQNLIDYVKGYNQSVEDGAMFQGIHLDIEPYVLQSWDDNKTELMRQWVGNLEYFASETRKNSNLEASMDLAMWLDEDPAPGKGMPFNRWVIQTMDHTSVMAFRDFTEGRGGILFMAEEELDHAKDLGKDILLSVEMKENPYVNHISFHEEGASFMEQELKQLNTELSDHPTYKGTMVHSYRYWINAKP